MFKLKLECHHASWSDFFGVCFGSSLNPCGVIGHVSSDFWPSIGIGAIFSVLVSLNTDGVINFPGFNIALNKRIVPLVQLRWRL